MSKLHAPLLVSALVCLVGLGLLRSVPGTLAADDGLSGLKPSFPGGGGDDNGNVFDSSRNNKSNGSVRVIVTYGNARGKSAAVTAASSLHHELDSVDAVAITIPAQALDGLRNNPNIVEIETDEKRYPVSIMPSASGDGSSNLRGAAAPSADAQSVRGLAGQRTPYGIAKVQANQIAPDNANKIRVCVVDTGYDNGHEDLPSDSTTVTGEGTTWDNPLCSHGSHVAGTIAALNNDVGVVGVVPEADMHIVNVFAASGCSWSYGSDIVDAIDQCKNAGAKIMTMSLGSSRRIRTEERAFKRAFNNDDLLFVAAAGNDGNTAHSFPASYNEVVSVAATDANDNVAWFSQKTNQVELAAPGVAVESTIIADYAFYDGTSMATPHVSAAAALVWSYHPTCTASEIRNALTSSALDLGPTGRDNASGHGLVQALDAKTHLDDNPCGGGGDDTGGAGSVGACILGQSRADCSDNNDCCSGNCKNGKCRG